MIHTKDELVAEYERTTKYYKEHKIQRNFSKYAEMFWLLFDDGNNPYMYWYVKKQTTNCWLDSLAMLGVLMLLRNG